MSAAPSLSPRERECPFCRKRINAAALRCRYCGESLSVELRVAYAAPWSRGVAALLSVFIPGAGQIYKGHVGRGFLFLLLISMGYMVSVFAAVVLPPLAVLSTILVCHFAVVVDAATTSVRVPAEPGHWWASLTWKERVVVALVLLLFAALLAYDVMMMLAGV